MAKITVFKPVGKVLQTATTYTPSNQTQEISQTGSNQSVVATSAKYLFSINERVNVSLNANQVVPTSSISAGQTSANDMLVNFITFSVASRNSNGATGSATLPYFECLINGITVFMGALPQECADSKDVIVNQVIDVTDFFLPAGSLVQVRLGASSTGGNGYSCNVGFGLTGASL